MDEIRIDNLEVYAYHGVYPKEKAKGQTFCVNAVLRMDIRRAGLSDRLEETVDYGEVCHYITKWMNDNKCDLIEAVAERLAQDLLLKYDLIRELELEIKKPHAPVGLPFDCVSVRVRRGWHRVYLSLGSNMGDRESYLKQGISTLEENPLIRVKKRSGMLVTKPYGGVEQEDFLNAALELETLLFPHELLKELHRIEAAADRKREVHWGPRTLDLDILFYDALILGDDELAIPHADLENRYFVLKPLAEIAPNLRHPVSGRTVAQMLAALEECADTAPTGASMEENDMEETDIEKTYADENEDGCEIEKTYADDRKAWC